MKEEFKKKVVSWLNENRLFPKIVKVYNTRRYGFEVRVYCPPVKRQGFKSSFRTTSKEKVGENGIRKHGSRGIHEIIEPMYIHINEQDFSSEDERQFILTMVKDSAILYPPNKSTGI